MALSMEEQRILDAMERKLADEDPKLATRLSSFGQPRLPGSGKARAVVVLVSLALAAVVTLMIYQMRPANGGTGRPSHPHQRVVSSTRAQPRSQLPATASAQPSP